MAENIIAICPECEGEITLDADIMAYEITQCPHCGVELEVVQVDPIELQLAPEVEEDWGE